MRNAFLAALLVCVAVLATAVQSPASSQEELQVQSDNARNEFPRGVTFSVSFSPPGEVRETRVRYRLAPDGTGASAIAQCGGGAFLNCTFTLTSGRGIFVIPGAEITYHWEVELAGGRRLSTPDKLYVHEDTRFDFRTIVDGNVTVYFHSGTEDSAPSVLRAATETLTEIGDLEQTQVTFPVKVFLYETADEMSPAVAPNTGRGVQILGEVVYSDTAMVSADVATLDITRHELAHIVTRQATLGPFGVPDWMNEGISVFAQRQTLPGHQAALDDAIRRDHVLTMRELGSSTAGDTSGTVGLYYSQAGSIVRFMIETFGREKFAELLRTFKDGSTPDKAFMKVYGFDALGLENRWRESVGLEPRVEQPAATPTRERGTPDDGAATPAPDAGGTSNEDGGGMSARLIVVLAVLGAAAVAAIAGAAAVAVRRLR